jgi:hypothetical protein
MTTFHFNPKTAIPVAERGTRFEIAGFGVKHSGARAALASRCKATAALCVLSVLCFAGFSVHASENLLENGGFEDCDGSEIDRWKSSIGFGQQSAAASDSSPHEGTRHVVLSITSDDSESANGGPGLGPARAAIQQESFGGSVSEGKSYRLTFHASTPTQFPPGVAPRYLVEWIDPAGQSLGPTIFQGFGDRVGLDGTYEEITIELTGPPGADRARVFFDLEGGSGNNPNPDEAILYLDSISLQEAAP